MCGWLCWLLFALGEHCPCEVATHRKFVFFWPVLTRVRYQEAPPTCSDIEAWHPLLSGGKPLGGASTTTPTTSHTMQHSCVGGVPRRPSVHHGGSAPAGDEERQGLGGAGVPLPAGHDGPAFRPLRGPRPPRQTSTPPNSQIPHPLSSDWASPNKPAVRCAC